MTCSLFSQTAGQSVINKKNVGSGYTLEAVTLPNDSVLGRNGAGALASYGLSLGGNGAADDGKLAVYDDGGLGATRLMLLGTGSAEGRVFFYTSDNNWYGYLQFSGTGDRAWQLPDASGTLLLSNGSGASLTALNASNISSGSLALARLADGGATAGQVLAWNGTQYAPATVSGASPAGSGSELQVRASASTFGAVAGSSAANGGITLAPSSGSSLTIAGGTAGVPAMVFSGDPDTGIYSAGADSLGIATGGAQRASFGVVAGVGTLTLNTAAGSAVFTSSNGNAMLGGPNCTASLTPYWTANHVTGSLTSSNRAYVFALGGDVIMVGDAAAVLQHGSDGSSEIQQAIKAADGSGTDKDGFDFHFGGGKSTGTGRGGDLVVHTSETGSASNSTANEYTTRSYFSAKPVTLTESSATTIANISIASAKYAGAKLSVTVFASDSTDHQCVTTDVYVDAINKTGTVTPQISQVSNTTAASSGTLSVTFTAVANGNSVDIKANAVSSLTQTTLSAKWAVTSLNTNGTDSSIRASNVTPQ